MEGTISIKEVIKILRKHIMTIVISLIFGGVIASSVTFFIIPPKFSSQAQLIVKLPQSSAANANDVNINLQMINTYKDMVVSDVVLNTVKERLKSENHVFMSAEEIKKAISVNQSQNSQMFSIQAISVNPKVAQQIANTTAHVFQKKAKSVMNVDKISIVSGAAVEKIPVSPNNKLNVAIGLVLGLLVGMFLSFFLEILDRTIKDEKDVSELLDIPILGTVSEMTAKDVHVNSQKEKITPQMKRTSKKSRASRRKRSKI
ncbi:Wzz/FepE/Etk N-terminal domain-containing protein [Enterococcus ratti]|uniref:YveK family protein n=1 Tax=Enterococcus ratti TaxID=150033 RepID=UPI00351103B9